MLGEQPRVRGLQFYDQDKPSKMQYGLNFNNVLRQNNKTKFNISSCIFSLEITIEEMFNMIQRFDNRIYKHYDSNIKSNKHLKTITSRCFKMTKREA